MERFRRQVASAAYTAEVGERAAFALVTPPGDSGAVRCPVVAEAERSRRSVRGAQTGANPDLITRRPSPPLPVTTKANGNACRFLKSSGGRNSVNPCARRWCSPRYRIQRNARCRGNRTNSPLGVSSHSSRTAVGWLDTHQFEGGITGRQSLRGRLMSGSRHPSLARRRCHRAMRTC